MLQEMLRHLRLPGPFTVEVIPDEAVAETDGSLTYAVNDTDQTLSVVSFNDPTATTVTVPAAVSINEVDYQVTAIGPVAFMDNKMITTADLPNSITVIGARAFKGCENLSQMTSHD